MSSFPDSFIGKQIDEVSIEDGSSFDFIVLEKEKLIKKNNLNDKTSIIIFESFADMDGCIESELKAYKINIPQLSYLQTDMLDVIKNNNNTLLCDLRPNTLDVLLRFGYVIRNSDLTSVSINPQIVKYL